MHDTAGSTTSSIHGHQVIHLIHDHASTAQPLTRQTLTEEVARRFGADARFHTCSAHGMTLDQLLHFLVVRQKVVERDGRLIVNIGEVCSHDDHQH